MKRVSIKVGDVFFVKVDDFSKRYFQYITNDLKQLNSDVIRAFDKVYPIDSSPDIDEIIQNNILFYAHCVTKWGVKLGFWEKVGNVKEVGSFENILFRGTRDYGVKKGECPVKISSNWYVWRINDAEFTHVGKLEDENRKAEIGVVMDPESIVHRIRTGHYDGFYPSFE
ncbi:hypothetical protein [Flavobacterium collinsii]|uniref:Immunity protein 26 of polymorphic toxin system n=1 Tax=Flavobacterium collinsii TaxID=1114861 RepID=A0ABM8KFN5_9FLAO|nr:hypothetical protein [Flavobacterium collinsii]CAA9196468.1 hypothetical protein FLACOL7796_01185 [Flavobacterium collinsii]